MVAVLFKHVTPLGPGREQGQMTTRRFAAKDNG